MATQFSFRGLRNRYMHRQSGGPILSMCISAVVLSSCGFLDAYKEKEKRCKINCKTEDSSTQSNNQPFNFDLNFWNQTTPRSKLDPVTEVASLIKSNPFKLLSNALKTINDDTNDAKTAASSAPLTTQGACLKEIFGHPFEKSKDLTNATLDYGKCIDLQKLQERLNANRNTDRDGKLKVIEIGSALQIKNTGSLPLKSGQDGLHEAGNGFEISSAFPLKSISQADVLEDTIERSFSIQLVRGSVQGVALERTSAATILKKSWGLLYAGLSDQEPLRMSWSPALGQLKIAGSLATLSASFQRPTTQSQWDSFGYSREFIFADFSLSSPDLEIGPQLGWNEQVKLSGSYFLRLNGDLVGTGGAGSQLFRMEGSGQPCLLKVTLVTGFKGQEPVEEPVGQISICGSSQ